MRKLSILAIVLLSACATTGEIDIADVDVRPITQIKAETFDPVATIQNARSNFAAENYVEAASDFNRLIAFDPGNIEAKLGAGESYLALGQFDQAANVFWNEKNSYTAEYMDRFKIGHILSGIYTDKFSNPGAKIHDGFLVAPNDARLWNAKGQSHDRNGEWMEALFSYVTALETEKWRSGTINNMGMSLMLQGRYEEAEKKFDQAIELSPDTRIYDNNLRMTYILQGDFKKALSDIEDSRASDIFNDAGYVAMQQNKSARAQLFFNKALDISPVHHAKAQANLDALEAADQAP